MSIQAFASKILQYNVEPDPQSLLHPDIARAIESVMSDPIIPSIMQYASTFNLMDSAE